MDLEKRSDFLGSGRPKLLRLAITVYGKPKVSSVWYLWLDNHFWISTSEDRLKVKAIRKNPHVAVIVDTDVMPYEGVIVEGEATLEKKDLDKNHEGNRGKIRGPKIRKGGIRFAHASSSDSHQNQTLQSSRYHVLRRALGSIKSKYTGRFATIHEMPEHQEKSKSRASQRKYEENSPASCQSHLSDLGLRLSRPRSLSTIITKVDCPGVFFIHETVCPTPRSSERWSPLLREPMLEWSVRLEWERLPLLYCHLSELEIE